ncbi:MAG: three-Cys-motif partner protein TcmP [Verrucomicrobiota bacterium]
MPPSEKPVYTVGSDGLPARISGQWARRKHHYLRNYCGITTKSMKSKFRLVYLDAMSGPGLCIEEKSKEEFPGSPFVALDFDFSAYYFIEGDKTLFAALDKRLEGHPKRSQMKFINENWIDVAESGRLEFDSSTLVVAFIDPTGIADIPMKAMHKLMENPRIDLLVTIQYRLGLVWNAPLYQRSDSDDLAVTQFLGHSEWRKWQARDSSEFGRMAIDDFCGQIETAGFRGSRHVSVPETNPFYRFALFSRNERAGDFWEKILRINEKGQREWTF